VASRRNRDPHREGIDMADTDLADTELADTGLAGAAIAPGTPLTLSERAAKRIREIMRAEEAGSMLRISVSGGGCSGFQYAFDVVPGPAPDDLVIERDGARVAIDEVSLPFLQGSRLDFVDDLIGQSFRFENPNATSSCGCGTSFSV
jgi:iron-sulfur cluster assembly accessory protein